MYKTTNIAPFDLMLAKAPRSIALQAQPSMEDFGSSRAYYLKCKSWFYSEMRATGKSLRKEQARYKRNFDAGLRRPKYEVPEVSYIVLRKEQGKATKPKHKLAKVVTGPYRVNKSHENTVVIAIGDHEERISAEWIEIVLSPLEEAPMIGLTHPLQSLGGVSGPEKGSLIEAKNRLTEDETQESEDRIRADRQVELEIAENKRIPPNSSELAVEKDLQEGEEDVNEVAGEEKNTEYVIDKIVDDGHRDGTLILKFAWCSYEKEGGTWELIVQLRRSAVVTYFRRQKQALPPQTSQAKAGRFQN